MNPLRTHRLAKGMTQAQLADKMGISRSHLCELETGAKTFTLPMFAKWAACLALRQKDIIAVVKSAHIK